MNNEVEIKKLNEAFGGYREEWLTTKVYEFYTEPSYFIELKDGRPCVLQGGRGTGKTTVLWGLSYKGQYNLCHQDIKKFDENHFIGIYQRIDTSHARSFRGKGICMDRWLDLFGHYLNLIFCFKIVKFMEWHLEMSKDDETLSPEVCEMVAESLFLEGEICNLKTLCKSLDKALHRFQAKINNVSLLKDTLVSSIKDPITLLVNKMLELRQFSGKMVYFLIDEYENLLDEQQMLANTLIKHTGMNYTFKIGVRELGWRVKNTINEQEHLIDPNDYVLFNIEKILREDKNFPEFAKSICQKRIEKLYEGSNDGFSFVDSLVSISMEDEAERLDVNKTRYIKVYSQLPDAYQEKVQDVPSLYKFLISYWASVHSIDLKDAIDDFEIDRNKWDQRYENYKHSMLFKIKKGRGAVGIQKYYAGWKTFLKLSNGNIRYLMELVSKAFERHLNEGHGLLEPVSPENQTLAAQSVGQKNIEELEGLWENGARITRLLYGLGRIFNLLAREEGKVRPEVNQFSIDGIVEGECKKIIDSSVMNLAFIRMTGNKLAELESTKSFIYAIHPIYAPFFVFSHRRKRKLELTPEEFMYIITNQQGAIKQILRRNGKDLDRPDDPNQLTLSFDEEND